MDEDNLRENRINTRLSRVDRIDVFEGLAYA